MTDDPSTNRRSPSRELVTEAIDRNHHKTWSEYAETFEFTIRDDGVVGVSTSESDRERRVTVVGGAAVACTCYSHRNAIGRTDCRHMRAVDAHPRL